MKQLTERVHDAGTHHNQLRADICGSLASTMEARLRRSKVRDPSSLPSLKGFENAPVFSRSGAQAIREANLTKLGGTRAGDPRLPPPRPSDVHDASTPSPACSDGCGDAHAFAHVGRTGTPDLDGDGADARSRTRAARLRQAGRRAHSHLDRDRRSRPW